MTGIPDLDIRADIMGRVLDHLLCVFLAGIQSVGTVLTYIRRGNRNLSFLGTFFCIEYKYKELICFIMKVCYKDVSFFLLKIALRQK